MSARGARYARSGYGIWEYAWTGYSTWIEEVCHRDPLSGGTVTGGIVTCRDSNWLMSWTINRQQQFREQP